MTPVRVSTTSRKEDVVIDHDNEHHRKWLAKMCWWAFRNGHSVTTSPTDEEPNYVTRWERKNHDRND